MLHKEAVSDFSMIQ